MALDRNALRDALITAFEQGMDNSEWTKEDAAQAMADAIDAFVRGADVVGIEVEVVDDSDMHLGTGTQIGTGTLE